MATTRTWTWTWTWYLGLLASVAAQPDGSGAAIAMHEYGARIGQVMSAAHQFAFDIASAQCGLLASAQGDSTFTMLDLGTANGLGSLPLVHECVRAVRRISNRSIAVIFEDGPWNDFMPLLKLDAASTFGEGVYPLVSSVSFFRACAPPNTVQLAFSSAAMHYLSGREPPTLIKLGGLHHTDATADEQAAFARQAARDWEALLLARAAELAAGGRFVLANFAIDERGQFMGSTDYGASVYAELSACLREMAQEGLLTSAEVEAATSPEYYRTLAEHRAPFEDAASPVRRAGLSLVSAELRHDRCALRLRYLRGDFNASGADAYGAEFARSVSAFSRHKVLRAFAAGQRAAHEQAALADEAFARFGQRVAARPLAFGIDNVMALLVVRKDGHGGGSVDDGDSGSSGGGGHDEL